MHLSAKTNCIRLWPRFLLRRDLKLPLDFRLSSQQWDAQMIGLRPGHLDLSTKLATYTKLTFSAIDGRRTARKSSLHLCFSKSTDAPPQRRQRHRKRRWRMWASRPWRSAKSNRVCLRKWDSFLDTWRVLSQRLLWPQAFSAR